MLHIASIYLLQEYQKLRFSFVSCTIRHENGYFAKYIADDPLNKLFKVGSLI